MYELCHVKGNTYYIDSPAKIGLYIDGKDAYLIDSGNDAGAGRKVQKTLEAQGWNLKAIICTHSHADHIGGNKLLQDRLKAPVYTSPVESAFVEYPLFEPAFLYGGFPPRELRNKFLLAPPSEARDIRELQMPAGMEWFELPGHSFAMMGITTPDGVCFPADCMVAERIIEKYHVSYLFDVKSYLETLEGVRGIKAEAFIPAHSEPLTDINALADANRDKVLEVAEFIESRCAEPIGFEDVLAAVFKHYGLTMDFNQYALVGSTVRSYLAYLSDAGKIKPTFEKGRLTWSAAGLPSAGA